LKKTFLFTVFYHASSRVPLCLHHCALPAARNLPRFCGQGIFGDCPAIAPPFFIHLHCIQAALEQIGLK